MNTFTLHISNLDLLIVTVLLAVFFILFFINNILAKKVEDSRKQNIKLMEDILFEECKSAKE